MPDEDVTTPDLPRGSASGLGSMPGTDVGWALEIMRDALTTALEQDVARPAGVPFLPELPARGPGADLVGRAAVRLVDLPVDVQPTGWRLVDRPGRDMARAIAFWHEDLDRFAEVLDGWSGPVKVQVAGPWTLAAGLALSRGERAVSEPGARRDLVASSAESVARLVADVRGAVPGADVVLQLDEPSLPAVLDGSLPTVSGLHRLRPVPVTEVVDGLSLVLTSARRSGAATLVHCCAGDPPVALLRRVPADGLSIDTSVLGPAGWESVAAAVEEGMALWAGAVPTSGGTASGRLTDEAAAHLAQSWRDVGLGLTLLTDLVVTPACGLAAGTPDEAERRLRAAVTVQQQLVERAAH